MTATVVYAPSQVPEDVANEELYGVLQSLLNCAPRGDTHFALGREDLSNLSDKSTRTPAGKSALSGWCPTSELYRWELSDGVESAFLIPLQIIRGMVVEKR